MNLTLMIISFIFGFVIDYLISGKKVGDPGIIPSLKFKIKKYYFHLHHWLGLLLILIILILITFFNEFVYGFLIGMIAHNMTMSDSFRIITLKKK